MGILGWIVLGPIAIGGAFLMLVFYDALTGRGSTRGSGRVGA
ncbi:MAG: hypothetical protein ACR2L8_14110 [Solirubrobacteraceae bacterium]